MDLKEEDLLKERLAEFEVEVPDFPVKKSKMDRISNWFFAPAAIPFPESGYTVVSSLLLLLLPIFLVIGTFFMLMVTA